MTDKKTERKKDTKGKIEIEESGRETEAPRYER